MHSPGSYGPREATAGRPAGVPHELDVASPSASSHRPSRLPAGRGANVRRGSNRVSSCMVAVHSGLLAIPHAITGTESMTNCRGVLASAGCFGPIVVDSLPTCCLIALLKTLQQCGCNMDSCAERLQAPQRPMLCSCFTLLLHELTPGGACLTAAEGHDCLGRTISAVRRRRWSRQSSWPSCSWRPARGPVRPPDSSKTPVQHPSHE